ncbi:MAG TPA: hypothetical protein VFY36_03475, partial [Solirubrobacteraceae bacterium]|nr:hypothetical protein [Solirubrobacteraceae bacterium]
EARLDQAAFSRRSARSAINPWRSASAPDRELLAIAVSLICRTAPHWMAPLHAPRSALAMSANPQTTIERK